MQKTSAKTYTKPRAKKPTAANVAESAFDALYLTASLALSIGLFVAGKTVWGLAVIVLFVGDALHLTPRIYRFATGKTSPVERLGKIAASVTMTLFYVMIWWRAALLLDVNAVSATAVITLAVVRIAMCFIPRSFTESEPSFLPLLRNVPFVALGAIAATQLGMLFPPNGAALTAAIAIAASFAFYLPVTMLAKRDPKIGMLMIPKSCTYLLIAALGFAI